MGQGLSTREAYGRVLVELGSSNNDVVVLDADLTKSTMTYDFFQKFPDRAFNCGIAEQNMIGIAAGLAASGKTVFASSFAVFATSRCMDQLRLSVAQPGRNVKIVGTHSGISVGEDGSSHQAIEDLALACALPGFTVVAPADDFETIQAIRVSAGVDGPFYIRLSRPRSITVNREGYRFALGKAVTLRRGTDVTIIANGLMVAKALEAADHMKGLVSCRVINMPTLKPLDKKSIVKAAVDTGAIVTAEEHSEYGGMFSMVARVVVSNHPVPMESIAIRDTFAKSGTPEELFKSSGLSSTAIEEAVQSVILRKKQ
ncbi:MAG: transketolase C-terminal domain-containing protein [Chloroflexota bacterium]|nr:transketolase C-terminal domain-containing protein [Chloroflexota bacterium]